MGSLALMPGTLVEEQWEDIDQDEDEIGTWKLPNKLIRWIKQSRVQSGGKKSFRFESVWGYISVFLM
jgi:hypothetical protein